MPAKMARSATQPPFQVPGLRPSSAPPGALVRERKKRKNPRRFGVHLENPGRILLGALNPLTSCVPLIRRKQFNEGAAPCFTLKICRLGKERFACLAHWSWVLARCVFGEPLSGTPSP